MMAAAFLAMALIPNLEKQPWLLVAVYGISFFFTEFGPNATTFVYPSEIFPVRVRTTGHGIAAAMGKLGGFIGVFTFPFLMRWHGLLSAELGAAIVSGLGAITTFFLLPEPKGKSLEEIEAESASLARRVAA
jgi:MFS transporter, PHS family, inorganic phosphate transporter